jgi:predicted  nucleic acid-binding Zn-ribbon protein
MMSDEEWERKMDFLLNQQARFDAEMYELKAAQAASEKRLDRISETLSSYATSLYENFKVTDAEIRELRQAQKLTDEQLRKFIAKVDRLTGEDQNGLQN